MNEKEEIISNYLLMEFDKLHQRADLQEQSIANKVNFFLVSVSAVMGGIFVIGSGLKATPFLWLLVSIVSFVMLIIGVSTFLQTLDLTANATFYYRRAGRIRRWFLDFDHSMAPYMPFVPSDEQPPFLPQRGFLRGTESVLVLLNALLASSFVTTLSWKMYENGDELYLLPTFVITFGLAWLFQTVYTKRYLHHMDVDATQRQYTVLYPSIASKQMFAELLTKYMNPADEDIQKRHSNGECQSQPTPRQPDPPVDGG